MNDSDTETTELRAVRTKGIYDPEHRDYDRTVVVFEAGRVSEIRDDVPNDVPLVADHDGVATPGLVDAHSHATIRPWEGNQLGQLGAHRTTATVRAVNNLRTDLEAGTTTMRLMAEEGYLDVRLAEAEQSGELESPRLLPSGIHLTPTDGHGMVHSATDGVEEIRRRIRENMREGATHTKYFATGGISSDTGSPGQSQYSREEVRTIVDETHRHEKHVATHAHGGAGARMAIEEGVDTIEHANLFGDEEIDMLEGSDQYVVGNFAIGSHPRGIEAGDADNPAIMAKLRESRETSAEAWRQILQTDVNIAIGTDSMHGYMYYEAGKIVELGATTEQALNAATLDAARAIDREDEVGSVTPGKRGDLVLLDGDPTEDISALENPAGVFKDGVRVA
ncbi:Imidazolonepropionase [Halogranum gelatinilyticum]|uniref:Imidazolonepropionase n=1 Tax=Halogranum gelatinilyticum TaxID=660521 RepID=A0A1G9Z031_9EURY|nr:amidohydrolase family protein [Halogranum gelatinilyticum]SDN14684.1 Imidazolonepropionase [Halogranum gelatinilyticum]